MDTSNSSKLGTEEKASVVISSFQMSWFFSRSIAAVDELLVGEVKKLKCHYYRIDKDLLIGFQMRMDSRDQFQAVYSSGKTKLISGKM